MKNNLVNPKRLKKGVIYKFTRRITGVEFWRFKQHYVTDDCWHENRYVFEQIHGSWMSDGQEDTFDSIDLVFFMYYTNKDDKLFIKNNKMVR